MTRTRLCVECPYCGVRYIVSASPYSNGSHLINLSTNFGDEYLLYCSCARPSSCSRWKSTDIHRYRISQSAHLRGYGSSEEISAISNKPRRSPLLRTCAKKGNLV